MHRFAAALVALLVVRSNSECVGAPLAQPNLRAVVEPGRWPTWSRGDAAEISVAGNHAYVVLRSGGLAIYDVAQPSSVVQVANLFMRAERSGVLGLAVEGRLACVAKGEDGMDIVDVSNPGNPRVLSAYRGYGADVAISGRFAYIAGWNRGLSIVDLDDPKHPVEVGRYLEPLIGERFETVAVSGRHAFVSGSDYTDFGRTVYFVHAIDVSNPTNCVKVGSYSTSGFMAVAGHFIYVNEGEKGVSVIDFSDPSRPARIGHYDRPGKVGPVVVSGNYIYVARQTDGMEIFDVSDPSKPVRTGGYVGNCVNLAVSGSQVYVVNSQGWEIVDVTVPSAPIRVASQNTAGGLAGAVAVADSFAYLAEGGVLRIIDVHEQNLMVNVGTCEVGGLARDVVVSGGYAYVANAAYGLQVIDVRDPTKCRRVAGDLANGTAPARAVAIAGHHLYVASASDVLVFDVGDPTAPVKVAEHNVGAPVHAISLAADRAYVAAYTNGIIVLDISDPAKSVRLAQIALDGAAVNVVAEGNRAYVLSADDGDPRDAELAVLDVTEPARAIQVADLDRYGFSALALSDHHLYLTSGALMNGGELLVLDLDEIPAGLDEWDDLGVVKQLAWPAWDLALSNGKVYAAAGAAGLYVIPTIPNMQFCVRVEALPDTPFVLEAATDLSAPDPWLPLAVGRTTTMPFDYVDYDVKPHRKVQKFYRVRSSQE